MVVEVYVYYSLKRKIEVANLLCNCIAHLLCAAYCWEYRDALDTEPATEEFVV